MAIYLRGKYWWVSLWKDGRHIQVSTKLKEKRKAKAVEEALRLTDTAVDGAGARLDIREGKYAPVGKNVVVGLLQAIYGEQGDNSSLTGIWDEYMDVQKVKGKEVTPKNLRDKRSCLEKFIDWGTREGIEYIRQVNGAVAKKYALSLVNQCSPKRRRNILAHLSVIWNAVIPNHEGFNNPWSVLMPSCTNKGNRIGFTREEEEKILEESKKVNDQWYVACVIARHTGLRYGSVCRLEWGMVDFKRNVIELQPSKTKDSSGVWVLIPMDKVLRKVMNDWRLAHKRSTPHDRVLPWLREFGPKDEKRFSYILKRVGIDPEKYSFHSWRHTFRSRLAEAGVSTELAMKLCGHVTEEMSRHYNHYDYIRELTEAVEKSAN